MSHSTVATQTQVNRAFLWKVSFIAGLGGILYGYDIAIIAAALNFVRDSFQLSTRMQGWIVSIVSIGSMVGAVAGGSIADRIGRRATLLWGSALFILGSVLAFLAPNVVTLMVARTMLGLAIGFTSVTAPVFVSELSPPQSRGRLIGLYQFALTAGIALADISGYWLAGGHAWRAMFGVGALPAALFFVLLLTLPESPRWLYGQNRIAEAVKVLKTYTDEAGAALFLEDINNALRAKTERRWSALWSPSVRKFLFIAVGFTILQPFTGINAIISYGPQIFAQAGISSNESAIFATFIVAATNMLATIIALVLVDRLGRKPLLYFGVGGMSLSLTVLSYAFHAQMFGPSLGKTAMICLVAYIAFYAFSMGPIAWILVSEVFPLQVRGRGVAAATLGFGASNSLVLFTFLRLIQVAGNSATFAIYAISCVAVLLFVRFVVPETAGRELESISAKPSAVGP